MSAIADEGIKIQQQAYLKASNTDGGDQFGETVAISGNTLVVGAVTEDSGATGVNGDQADNSQPNAGAVYVFTHNGTAWRQKAYLKASNPDSQDLFGSAVAISGDTLVVGAYFEASNTIGVNGDQENNSIEHAGAAYVFIRSGSDWVQQAYLKPSITRRETHFGSSVAISGDTLVVGGGGAYVFTRNGTNWSQQALLMANDSAAGDEFGGDIGSTAVAIWGETVVVGARAEESSATGVNGNSADNSARRAGAAYVFTRSGTEWTQQAYLKASNTGFDDEFGHSVAISDDTIVISAPNENSNATGVNGDQKNKLSRGAGAAYVFTRDGATWSQQAYLKASNSGGNFGWCVAISGDSLAVGAYSEQSGAVGINGDQQDNSTFDAGAVYTFTRNESIWSQQAYVKASNTGERDVFAVSMGLSGNSLVVGATHEYSNATGINGDQADNSALGAGAAYVFTGLSANQESLVDDIAEINVTPAINDSFDATGN